MQHTKKLLTLAALTCFFTAHIGAVELLSAQTEEDRPFIPLTPYEAEVLYNCGALGYLDYCLGLWNSAHSSLESGPDRLSLANQNRIKFREVAGKLDTSTPSQWEQPNQGYNAKNLTYKNIPIDEARDYYLLPYNIVVKLQEITSKDHDKNYIFSNMIRRSNHAQLYERHSKCGELQGRFSELQTSLYELQKSLFRWRCSTIVTTLAAIGALFFAPKLAKLSGPNLSMPTVSSLKSPWAIGGAVLIAAGSYGTYYCLSKNSAKQPVHDKD